MLLFVVKSIPDDDGETVGYTVKVYTDNGSEDAFSPWTYQLKEFCEFFNNNGYDGEVNEDGKMVTGEGYWDIYYTMQKFGRVRKIPVKMIQV